MPWQCHPTYAITGAMALAAACKSKKTICSDIYQDYSTKCSFKIEHPTGILEVKLDLKYKNDIIDDITVSTTRNARLIMSGDVHVKKSLIEN